MRARSRTFLSVALCGLAAGLMTAGLLWQNSAQFMLLLVAAVAAVGALIAALGGENASLFVAFVRDYPAADREDQRAA
jgi:hypothetical protein